jgi:2-octaprenyl-6-methoxyphenol hydroxylase
MRVCILGDGLSALTLAKALINQNIFVDIFIKKKAQNINRTRTLGISKYSLDFINKNIINIEKILWKIKRIEIFTDNLKDEKILNFKNNDQLFSIIKNYELYRILEKNLSKNKYFKKLCMKKENLLQKYSLVINTDYNNPITKKYFSKKIEKKYNSFAFTTIIRHKKISNKTAFQIFTKKGPLAFLPISENETSIVYSLDYSLNKHENIQELIKKYNFKYEIIKIGKIQRFDLKSLILRSYGQKNILAFGDLLHRIHPLAGQGFNMTVRDIIILIKIINQKINLGLVLDKSIISIFEKKIKHKNYIFSKGVDLINQLFYIERNINNSLFTKLIQNLGKKNFLNKIFIEIADEGLI